MKRSLLLYITLLLASVTAQAGVNRLFTTDHHLPNSLVNKVAESADEMIWVATEDGLCRFDGSQFVGYRHDEADPHSLSSNFVRTICTDAGGHVLVATLFGVQLYRPETDDFTTLICDSLAGIPEGNVSSLTLLSDGDFLATGNVTFTIHIDQDGTPHALPNPFTSAIGMSYLSCQDYQGNLWVIRNNDGIFRLDQQGNVHEVTDDGRSYGFASLGIGPDGCIYAGGLERGFFKYNNVSDRFDELTQPSDNFMVKDLCPLRGTQQMYVSTDGDGIKLLDCATGQLTPYLFDDAQVDASTQKVHSLALSQEGDLWMALYQKGVFVVAHNPLDFHYYGAHSLRYNCIGDRCITSLLRDDDGVLWVATDNGGLYGVDNEGRCLVHYPCTSQPGSVPSAFVRLFRDGRGRTWFGAYRQGGGIVDLRTGQCRYIPIEGRQGNNSNVYDYAEDKRGTLWAASMGNGILRYDEERQLFVPQSFHTSCDWSGALCYDAASDRLYAGTYNGIVEVQLGQGEISCQQYVPQVVVYSITRISPTRLSLCSNSGLILFDTQTHESRIYTTQDGLPNNNVYASQPDEEGHLWISGSNGLTRFNMRQETFTNYTEQDGLQCSEFYKNASWRDADGTLWFGGTMGITWFQPRHIHSEQQLCSVRIVSMRAGEQLVLPDAGGTYRIGADDHSFSIDLATRPILQTHTVSYRYALDGDPWQTLPPTVNSVSFSGISSGSHTFRFQIVEDGIASEVQEAHIRIARPWYRSWYATLIWLLLVGVIVWLLVLRYRRQRYERHLKRVHEREVAINEAKLQFFMNIAHEFRTPMTLVVSPLQKLISTDHDPQRQHSYQIIDRNANRVLELINELMDLRKIDKAQMRLSCRLLQPEPLVRELCESVSDLVAERQLQLVVDSQLPASYCTWIDQDCFDKILINLLSNAIKYTPRGGRIDVCIEQQADMLSLAVTDTGIGIAPQDRQHIFERFYQVRHAKNSIGTGIGLNLVHSLVRLHHGSIQVDDNPVGQGTRFTVLLPMSDDSYTDAEKFVVDESEALQPALEPTVSPTAIMRGALRSEQPLEPTTATGRQVRHLLVVDDDDEVRRYLEQELRANYRVTSCSDGQQALELLQSHPFDLVLSDVMMPQMDGTELCRRIRGNVRINHLPVILLTARSSDEDRLQSLEIGANAFLSKPFNMEIVLKTIQNLLSEHDRLRSSFSGKQLPVDEVATPELQSPDERLLQRILRVINDNLSNPELTSEMIADQVGLSRVHLYRKLKELTGQSARNYIRNIRLAKAAELLAQKKMAISEVAYLVGFANPNNFATSFKELYGMSPTAYNEQHCAENTSV